jgi:hypothetical protein
MADESDHRCVTLPFMLQGLNVSEQRWDELTPEVVEHLTGTADVYTGGVRDLEVAWLPQGTAFRIEEYDGNESIVTVAELPFVA